MGLAQRYRRPADLPPRIPVFPLRGAILLPRATLPLNIFEPRYLAMIDDVMSGGRVLGILQPAVAADTSFRTVRTARLPRCTGWLRRAYHLLSRNWTTAATSSR